MHGSRCRMKIKKVRKVCSSKIQQREAVGKIKGFNTIRPKALKIKNLHRAPNRQKTTSIRILVPMKNLSSKRSSKIAAISIRIRAIRLQESRISLDKIRIRKTQKAYSKRIHSSIIVANRTNPKTKVMIACLSTQLAMMTQAINVSKRHLRSHMKKNKKEFN